MGVDVKKRLRLETGQGIGSRQSHRKDLDDLGKFADSISLYYDVVFSHMCQIGILHEKACLSASPSDGRVHGV